MNKQNSRTIKSATESLQEILRCIGPFLPKHRKPEQKQCKTWERISEGTFPPMPYPKCKVPEKKS